MNSIVCENVWILQLIRGRNLDGLSNSTPGFIRLYLNLVSYCLKHSLCLSLKEKLSIWSEWILFTTTTPVCFNLQLILLRFYTQDFMRRLGVDLLIQPEETQVKAKESDEMQQRAVVNDECPRCKNPSLEYYTKQLRSADEGQTVFYECPKCHHKFSQNM